MEKCWDLVPSTRPHVADLLDLFESAARGWVSPTLEAIASLDLDRQTSHYTLAEPADTMSEITSGMIEVRPHEVG